VVSGNRNSCLRLPFRTGISLVYSKINIRLYQWKDSRCVNLLEAALLFYLSGSIQDRTNLVKGRWSNYAESLQHRGLRCATQPTQPPTCARPSFTVGS
jgi:hypothetical protein